MEGESVQADEKPRRVQVQVTVHIPGLLELIEALRPRRQPTTPRGADGSWRHLQRPYAVTATLNAKPAGLSDTL